MFQRDYILRLIEQLAKTLGAVFTLKKARRYDEAEHAVGEAARNLVGIDIETLLSLPLDQIVTLFSPGGSLDAGKVLVVAELLQEAGEIHAVQHREEKAYACRVRALGLFLEVSAREGLERIPEAERYLHKIEELDGELSLYAPVLDVEKRRLRHLERQGEFAGAEDALFALLDAGLDDISAPGIELYQRLLEKGDAELERGGLPRDEVEEGLAQLHARTRSV